MENNTERPLVRYNGKEVDTSQIDNYDAFMQYLVSAAQLSRLNKISKLLQDEMSEGWTQNIDITVTEIERELKPFTPAQSMFLVNDGPSNIIITINMTLATPNVKYPSESLSVDFKGHKLEKVYVKCLPGQTSAIRTLFKG